jgi:hypothetical protein
MKRKIETEHSVGLRTGPTLQPPCRGSLARSAAQGRAAHGHAAVAYLAESTGAPDARAWSPRPRPRATTRVPPVDRWPMVADAAAQAPGGLKESAGQRFKDGNSPG